MNKWRYNIGYNLGFRIKLISLYIFTAMVLLCSYIDNNILSFLLMIAIGSVVCVYCIRELNKRTEVVEFLKRKLRK